MSHPANGSRGLVVRAKFNVLAVFTHMEDRAHAVSVVHADVSALVHQASAVVAVPSSPYATFLAEYHVGDHAGILGLFVSVIGLAFTYVEARRSRTAAEAARDAAQAARRGRLLVDISMELSGIYDQLTQLKQTIRSDEWTTITIQIDSLCRSLEAVRQAMLDGSGADFFDSDKDLVSGAISKLREFENTLTWKGTKPPVDEKSQKAVHKQIVVPLTSLIDSITGLQQKAKLVSAKR
ncbi:hypothetical protein [Burkholderia gladioli]|uniref:hypothetical protein n=1 Tax=Burkholderia gladioli TaxID=28095 RepID=UPI00163E595C|nr:hypothetical protein [Burkholderia gladioli]